MAEGPSDWSRRTTWRSAEIADRLGTIAKNVHFVDHFENGTLHFDYLMRPGVVRKSNALAADAGASGWMSKLVVPNGEDRRRMLPRMRLAAVAVAVLTLLNSTLAEADGHQDNLPDAVRRMPKPGIEVPAADREALESGLAELERGDR